MTTTAKIGAFFLVALALLGFLVLKIEDIPIGKKARTSTVEVHFKDVAGLDDKSVVRIAGVPVGKVDGVKLLPDGTALAKIALDPNVELRKGAFGQIRSLGLLGDKYVELFPGKADGAKLNDGEGIEGNVPAGMEDITKLAAEIGKDLKEVSSALSKTLGGNEGEERLRKIVDNVGALADSLRLMVESNRENVDMTVANLREFSAEIRETLARVDRILEENRGGMKAAISNVQEVTDKLKTSADNVNSITGKIDSGTGTIGKLVNDEETHRNLNEALSAVKDGVNSLNTTLTRVNRIQLDIGFRGEYLSRDGGSKGFFTLDVVPRENKFYRVEIGALNGGKRRDTTETVTVIGPDGVPTTIKKVVQTYEDELALSLQLGYRLKNTVVRAGLIESRGGLAIDQMLFSDRFQLSGEAWDFARSDARGHVKLYGRWNGSPNIYLTGGVDDAMNPQYRSLFLGAGIRWKDEDIKSLLGALPLVK